MSEWIPKGTKRRAQSSGERIIRGFSRIGYAVAVVVFLSIAVVSAFIAVQNFSNTNSEFDRYACVLKSAGNRPLVGDDFKRAAIAARGCGYFSEYTTYQNLQWWVASHGNDIAHNGVVIKRVSDFENLKQSLSYFFFGITIALVVGALLYGILRGLGWAVAGFAKD